MPEYVHELRVALRSLARSPAFFAVASTTLVIAISINAAMFAFLNAVFFRPLPYESPSELYVLDILPSERGAFEAPTLGEATSLLSEYSAVAGYVERGFVVSESASGVRMTPERLQGSATDAYLFPLLGVRPRLGRAFTQEDMAPGAARTIIVGDQFWRARLGASAEAIGRTLRIDGVEHTVIGVMPPRISFPDFAQFWIPLSNRDAHHASTDVQVLLRVRDEGIAERVRSSLESAVAAGGQSARVRLDSIQPRGGALLAAILGAIGFVLLIACSNVANIVIARGTARRGELGLRAALGATRGSLVRYLSAEGVVLAAFATVLGMIASLWLTDVIVATIPMDGLPLWFDPRPDARTLAYTALLGLVAVVVAAAMPAFTLSRDAVGHALRESTNRVIGDARAGRLRSALIALQITLAVVLTAGAGLLIRAFTAIGSADLGFPADSVLQIATARAPAAGLDDRFATQALTQLSALPGAAAAAAAAPALSTGRLVNPATPDAPVSAVTEAVSVSYLRALGLQLIRGREFQSDAEANVMVISESLARSLWQDADAALGASVHFENQDASFSVIGVTADRREPAAGGLNGVLPVAHAYLPLRAGDATQLRFLVRASAGDPISLAPAVTEALRDAEPDVVLMTPAPLGHLVRLGAGNLRWFATIFSGLGTVALLLSAIGIYGVIAWTVGRRTREIGVRITLGATQGQIFQLILGSIVRPAGLGLGFGALGALGLGALLQSQLFGVSPADPAALLGSVLGFLLTITLAAGLPARRATRIDPLQATRSE